MTRESYRVNGAQVDDVSSARISRERELNCFLHKNKFIYKWNRFSFVAYGLCLLGYRMSPVSDFVRSLCRNLRFVDDSIYLLSWRVCGLILSHKLGYS